MKKLSESSFVDLYIGSDYAEIKGMCGAETYLIDLPEDMKEDAAKLKDKCYETYKNKHIAEFSLLFDQRVYRVTVSTNFYGSEDYVIRQTPSKIIPFNEIPFGSAIRRSVEKKGATGLFLIAGEMGCGKTTSAASVLSHRISTTGSLGVSIEDPIETLLHGRHGNGRCLQLEIGQDDNYASATKKAWRMGAASFLLGEIRDGATAHEVLKASLSMFVVSTIHASSVIEAIERYVMFCEEINLSSSANVASTLYVVAHQKMNTTFKDGVINGRSIDISAFNLKDCNVTHTIKAKIRQRSFAAISDELNAIAYNI